MANHISHPDRRSARLHHLDYTTPGLYFVTIVTEGRMTLFGAICDGRMRLNEAGVIVRDEWLKTAIVRPNIDVVTDELVVMPNHIHGIIAIRETPRATHRVAAAEIQAVPSRDPAAPADDPHAARRRDGANARPRGPAPGSVGVIVGQFKSATTRAIRRRIPSMRIPIWQRNYYEHVIRDQADLDQIRKYILENPAKWDIDRENPGTGTES